MTYYFNVITNDDVFTGTITDQVFSEARRKLKLNNKFNRSDLIGAIATLFKKKDLNKAFLFLTAYALTTQGYKLSKEFNLNCVSYKLETFGKISKISNLGISKADSHNDAHIQANNLNKILLV